MDEIYALQKMLAQVQETNTVNKLSDRVVVDLVEKLIKQHELRLIYTMDGQEYLTQQYLQQQIFETVQNSGRVNLYDLPKKLNVSMDKIEQRLEAVFSKNKRLIKLQDKLMTESYLDSVCEEINEDLQQQMQLNLSEITHQYSFPVDFVRRMLDTRLGNLVEGVFSANGEKLTTSSFQDIMVGQIKGCLRAATKQVSIPTLAKDYNIEENNIYQIIEDLIKSDCLDGKLQGNMYVPNRFLKNQDMIIRKFFLQNGYIEYDLMQRQLLIPKPKDVLKNMFKDKCIFLDSCCFDSDALLKKQEEITEFLVEEGYTDLHSILPTVLTDSDLDSLIFRHMKVNEVELVGNYIFSHTYLENCTKIFREKIIKNIYENPQKLIKSDVAPSPGGQKKNNEITGSSAPARGEGKKGGGGSKEESKSGSGKGGSGGGNLFSNEEILKRLEQEKIIDQEEREEEYVETLVELLSPRLLKYYEDIKTELFEKKMSASSEIIVEMQRKIEDILTAIFVSIDSIKIVEENVATVHTSLLMNNCLYATRLLLETMLVYVCKKYCIQLPPNLFLTEEKSPGTPLKNNLKRKVDIECGCVTATKIFQNKQCFVQALEMMPPEYQAFFKNALEFYLKKQLKELINCINSNSGVIGVKVSLDQKIIKSFLSNVKFSNKEVLQKEIQTDPYESVHRLLSINLADQNSLFFIGNSDDEFDDSLLMILYGLEGTEEPIKVISKQVHDIIHTLQSQEEPALEVVHEKSQILTEQIIEWSNLLQLNIK